MAKAADSYQEAKYNEDRQVQPEAADEDEEIKKRLEELGYL